MEAKQPNGALIPKGGGDNIPLTRSPLTIGRRDSCDICLQFSNISGKHCELTLQERLLGSARSRQHEWRESQRRPHREESPSRWRHRNDRQTSIHYPI
ncbi:MAG: FHA domain-containing protein [Gemmataceae bacterium]|nr:FHA domain-containing protein [Gemmataceae bacterium]